MKQIPLISLPLILLQLACFAQNPSEDYLGSWYTYGSNHRLTENISISPYAELRFYEPSSNYNLAYISARTNYHINPKKLLSLGYAYLDIDTVFEFDNKPNIIEHRIFEQYVYKHLFRKLKVSHRARFEQRFLDFVDSEELQNRFRYRIKINYNLTPHVFLFLSEEPFVNFQNQVFHENRFSSGLGLELVRTCQITVGYMRQNIRKNNLNRLVFGFTLQTDYRPKKSMLSRP